MKDLDYFMHLLLFYDKEVQILPSSCPKNIIKSKSPKKQREAEKLTCRICNNSEDNTSYLVKERMLGSQESFLYFKCKSCQCLQIASIPPNMLDFYPPNNHFLSKYRYEGIKGFFKLARIESHLLNGNLSSIKTSKINLYHILGKIGVIRSTRILGIGIGSSQLLYPLSKLGFRNVQSLDVNSSETISNPGIHQNEFPHIRRLWDIIIFYHSFEHIWNINETMIRIKNLLEPEGHCLISIPLVSSLAWKKYRTNWFQINAPCNFYLHSIRSMEIVAQQNGFEIDDIIFNSDYKQFVLSEIYQKGRKGNLIYREFKRLQFYKKAEQVNWEKRGDQAVFILKLKKSFEP